MPTIKMTARSIDALKAPASGRVEYFDAGLPGFGIRVADSGRKSWIAFYRHQGRLRRLTIGTYPSLSLVDARDAASDALRAAAKGGDPAGQKQRDRRAETFAELADLYLTEAKKTKRSWRKDEQIIKKDLLPEFRAWKAKDITRADVRGVLDRIVRRGAAIQANRTLEVIRRMFNWGIGEDIGDKDGVPLTLNPCAHIKKPARENRRDRVLSEDEIRALWEAIEGEGPLMAATFKLRLITAQRGGEVLGMRRDELNPELTWWLIPAERSKNKLPHRVPLTDPARKVLKAVLPLHKDSKWVFQSPKNRTKGIDKPMWAIWKAVDRIRARCGIEDFDPHDLRRSAASFMTSMGISRLTVKKLLNHAESDVTAVYDRHSYDPEKRAALEAWASRLEEILAARPKADNVVTLRPAGT